MQDNQQPFKPLPDWTAIFTLHPELEPPGYAEIFIHILNNPKQKPKEIEKEIKKSKKKKTKLGRNETF
jgi:hypothetical protein